MSCEIVLSGVDECEVVRYATLMVLYFPMSFGTDG